MFRFLSSTLIFAALFACKGNDEAGDLFEPAERAGELASAQCANNTRCRPAIYAFEVTDEGSCVQRANADFTDNFTRVKQAIEGGHVKFIADNFDACVDSLEDGDCAMGPADECETFFEGRRAAGEGCMFNFECTPDTYCTSDAAGACGECVARPGPRDACDNAPCPAGFGCTFTEDSSACVPIRAVENDACGTINTGYCRGSMRCVGAMDSATCKRPAAMGEDCDLEDVTAPACNAGAGLACVNDKCVARSYNDVGGSCDGGANACNVRGFCNDANQTCATPPADGQACAPGGLCAEEHYCDGAQCSLSKREGEGCADSMQCTGQLFCVEAGACGRLNWSGC